LYEALRTTHAKGFVLLLFSPAVSLAAGALQMATVVTEQGEQASNIHLVTTSSFVL